MKNKRIRLISAAFVVLVVLVVALMFANTLQRPASIQLPEEPTAPGETAGDASAEDARLTVVSVTPETVQAPIATHSTPTD